MYIHLNTCPLPDAVEDFSIGVNPQHDVLHGGVMDEGAFGVDEEDIRNPDLLHQPGVKCPALVVSRRERQPLVLPVVTQVQSHGEVLQNADTHQRNSYFLCSFNSYSCFSSKFEFMGDLGAQKMWFQTEPEPGVNTSIVLDQAAIAAPSCSHLSLLAGRTFRLDMELTSKLAT